MQLGVVARGRHDDADSRRYHRANQYRCAAVLLCTLAVLDPRVGHTMDVLSPFISVLTYSFTGSPVHVKIGYADPLAIVDKALFMSFLALQGVGIAILAGRSRLLRYCLPLLT